MLSLQKLPILQKAQLLKYGHLKPLSKYHTLCLSFIVPHGNTDMWMYPTQKYALNYGSSFACLFFQPMRIKFLFLFLYSFIHIKNDIIAPLPIQLAYSTGIHLSWVWFPQWALTYLAWIHTTLHYKRVISFLNPTQVFSLFVTHIFVFFLLQRFSTDDLSFGGAWIPLVIGHITTNA